ncbi:MAG: prepilin-type N-terminal cleavage/methylation domain-containing protein [Verrucomicrobiota bacterium]
MKFRKNIAGQHLNLQLNGSKGMTLVEIMVAMSVFSFAMIGLIYTHIYGLKLDQLVQSKLGASDQSRRSYSELCNDIRTAKGWAIGNGTDTSFTPINSGSQQKGNALKLYPTTKTNFVINTNIFIIYHFNPSAGELWRRGNDSALQLVARDLTNNMFFQAENYRGDIQITPTYRATIRTRLEFAQYQYPLTRVGNGCLYDYYKMEFCVTSHAPDGP